MKMLKAIVLLVPVFASAPVAAHHTTAQYDQQSEITITGAVTGFQWRNPHVYLWVEGESDNGVQAVWELEGQPPTVLKRLGWSSDSLKEGDHVTVKAQPARNKEQYKALMVSVEKNDDTVLDSSMQAIFSSLGTDDAPTTEQADSLSGTWITLLNFPAVFQFVDTSNLSVTEKGRASVESFVEERDSPAIQCIPGTSPLLMLTPDIKSIENTGDTIVIRSEFDNVIRTVYMNRDGHDDAAESIQGHSIGHWENGALVIDTDRFSPHRIGNGAGLPSGPKKHLEERLVLDESGKQLTYSFTLEDPDYLTEPVTGEAQWSYRPDLAFESLPCDIDNARRFAQ